MAGLKYNFFNDILAARLRSNINKVNNAAMPLFHNAPAETILFLGFSQRQQYTWRVGHSGKSPIELNMKFLEKNFQADGVQITHNHFWRPGVGWRILFFDGEKSFETANLSAIYTGT